ncbi:MAG: hypothetical protein LBC59_07650 [Chitinispirillales bacterium]|jgi:hypothetical protein|nr:hypothetical protein [Chitinispirillales bacterium]
MITAEKPRTKIYPADNDEIEDEEYSEEFLDELEREAEKTYRQFERGEIKPVSTEELAGILGVNLNG